MSSALRLHRASDEPRALPQRLAGLPWDELQQALDARGYALARELLTPAECAELVQHYENGIFRSRIVMDRHNFGRGEYKYFAYPLPDLVAQLRTALYPGLARIANDWNRRLGIDRHFPDRHETFLAGCHRAGQRRPTPLLLRYREGDYNCLHQDVYGDLVFPLQATILLSAPHADFEGGEFILTEQRPRMQSRAEVVPLRQGDAVLFAVRSRPMQGRRGTYRVNMRHGVSRLHRGERHALGIIFHDAQ
jgi:hypothetical protein